MSRSPNGKTRQKGNGTIYAQGDHMDMLTGIVIGFALLVAIDWTLALTAALKKGN